MRKYGETRIQGRGTNKEHVHLYYLGKVAKEKYAASWWMFSFLDELLYQSDLLTARAEMNSTVSRKEHSESYLTTGTVDDGDVQPVRRVWLCDPMDCSTPGFPVHHQVPERAQTHVHRVGDATNHLVLCLSLLLLPSIFPSIRVFSNELVLHIR